MMNSLKGILYSQQKMTVKDIRKWVITITKLDKLGYKLYVYNNIL